MRQKTVDEWALLHGAIVPGSLNEMAFKLSRHAIANDQVWTWIGCYGMARFPDNTRGGTYIGCGVIERDKFLDAARTLQYVLEVQLSLDKLKNGYGILVPSIFDVDEGMLGIQDIDLVGTEQPQRKTGVQPGKPDRLFLDLHKLKDREPFNAELIRFMFEGQWKTEFSDFSELVIGNSQALADNARRSKVYHVFTPETWKAALTKESLVGSALAQVSAPLVPVQKMSEHVETRPRPADEQRSPPIVPPPHAPAPNVSDHLRTDLLELDRKLKATSQRLEMLFETPEGHRILGRAFGVSALNLLSAALLVAVVVIGMLAMKVLNQPSSEVGAVPEPMLAPRMASVLPSCGRAPIPSGVLTYDEKRDIEDEQSCLENQVAEIKERVKTLEGALNRGNRR